MQIRTGVQAGVAFSFLAAGLAGCGDNTPDCPPSTTTTVTQTVTVQPTPSPTATVTRPVVTPDPHTTPTPG
jgi:hypothetical protein